MRAFRHALLFALLPLASAGAQVTKFVAYNVVAPDTHTKLKSGTVTITPEDINRQPANYKLGVAGGGVVTRQPVTGVVVNGQIYTKNSNGSLSDGMDVADGCLATPSVMKYHVVIKDVTAMATQPAAVDSHRVPICGISFSLDSWSFDDTDTGSGTTNVTHADTATHADSADYATDTTARNAATAAQTSADGKVAKTGDTMTGALTLPGNPTENLQATPKQYVDQALSSATDTTARDAAADAQNSANGKVAKTGDTMTGALTLAGNPTANLQAAPKQYVDQAVAGVSGSAEGKVAKSGDVMTGALKLPTITAMTASCFGTSLTQGGQGGTGISYPNQLAKYLGVTCANYGVGGNTSPQIQTRMGAATVSVTVSGGTIPTGAGPSACGVTVAFNPVANTPSSNNQYDMATLGSIAGVSGTVWNNAGTITFNPLVCPTSAVSVPSAVSWVTDPSMSSMARIVVIDPFRNDAANGMTCPSSGTVTTSNCQSAANLAAMVSFAHAQGAEQVYVLNTINARGESGTNTNYQTILNVNAYLAATYTNPFTSALTIPIREYLVADYDPTNPDDVIDHANDNIPYSLQAQVCPTIANAYGTLTAAITDTTSGNISLSSFCGTGFVVTVDSEQILIKTGSNGANTVTRGYAGTTAAIHASGASYTQVESLHLGPNSGYLNSAASGVAVRDGYAEEAKFIGQTILANQPTTVPNMQAAAGTMAAATLPKVGILNNVFPVDVPRGNFILFRPRAWWNKGFGINTNGDLSMMRMNITGSCDGCWSLGLTGGRPFTVSASNNVNAVNGFHAGASNEFDWTLNGTYSLWNTNIGIMVNPAAPASAGLGGDGMSNGHRYPFKFGWFDGELMSGTFFGIFAQNDSLNGMGTYRLTCDSPESGTWYDGSCTSSNYTQYRGINQNGANSATAGTAWVATSGLAKLFIANSPTAVGDWIKVNPSDYKTGYDVGSTYPTDGSCVIGRVVTANASSGNQVSTIRMTPLGGCVAPVLDVTPASGQIPVGNAAGKAYAAKTMGGDCTIDSTGVITCTKTSGTSFAASAKTDTTNAANIGSGTLPAGRMPGFSGDCTSTAGTTALTCSTSSGTVSYSDVTTAHSFDSDETNSSGHRVRIIATGSDGSGSHAIMMTCSVGGVLIAAMQVGATTAGGLITVACDVPNGATWHITTYNSGGFTAPTKSKIIEETF